MWGRSKPILPVSKLILPVTEITYMTALNTSISIKRGDIFPYEDYLKIQKIATDIKETKQLQDDIDSKQKIIDDFNYHASANTTQFDGLLPVNMSPDAKTALVEKFRKNGYNALIVENKFTVL